MKKIFLSISVISLLAFSIPPADAFNSDGRRWPGNVIPYAIDGRVNAATVGVINAAANEWNNIFIAIASPVRFVNMGVQNNLNFGLGPVLNCSNQPPANPNYMCANHALFQNKVDFAFDIPNFTKGVDCSPLQPPISYGDSANYEVLAKCYYTTAAQGQFCNITDADILFFYGFKNCGPIDWYINVNAANIVLGQYDMYSVCVHEMGHYLGLDHSAALNSVMSPSIVSAQIRRVPNMDDQNGVNFLYGGLQQVCNQNNVAGVPTVSHWGLMALAGLLAIGGVFFIRSKTN